ncbi:hypothetical protein [Maridesulfovibrio bastinii]|uniref:hypothetical protein n=1 Tax=Maridesulfovibrio bastinii TaxID=47157 RepID=UPI00041485A8|nr:hypothetical protein [Maridesulfovibrio bastinii]
MADHNATIGFESLSEVQVEAGKNCITRVYDFPDAVTAEIPAGALMSRNSDGELLEFEETVTGTVVGIGDGAVTAFNGVLGSMMPGSLSITDGVETFTDNGGGVLVSTGSGSGSVDYATGAWAVSFAAAPAAETSITADHDPSPCGVLKHVAEVGDTEAAVVVFGEVVTGQISVNGFAPTSDQLALLEAINIYPVG